MGIQLGQTYKKNMPKRHTGRYHALFIAVDQYQELEPLYYGEKDIEALEKVLGEEYGVMTLQKLINQEASHTRIRQALLETEKLSAEDTLLLVFSGHGRTDSTDYMNFWLPYDAESEAIDRVRWLPSQSVIAAMRKTPARHVLLISTGIGVQIIGQGSSRGMVVQRDNFMENALKYRSREVINSGFSEFVENSDMNGHSTFIYHLIQGLRNHPDEYLDSLQLYEYVKRGVSGERPVYRVLPEAGHQDDGSTVFFRTNIDQELR
ncbi:MAG: caspase family protein [Spirochaetales bacterium]|nr:caspase family protein [Spirochaetales bacterium]